MQFALYLYQQEVISENDFIEVVSGYLHSVADDPSLESRPLWLWFVEHEILTAEVALKHWHAAQEESPAN